jgi:hypothetical protein
MSKSLARRNKMNSFLKRLAWTGMAIFLFGAVLSFLESCALTAQGHFGYAVGHQNAFFMGLLGLIFMLIGGLTKNPRNFWLICIIAGLFHIASFFEIYIYIALEQGFEHVPSSLLAIALIPGGIAIVEGIWLKIFDKSAISETGNLIA